MKCGRLRRDWVKGNSAWYSTVSDSRPEFWHKPMAQVVLALKGEWPFYAVNSEAEKTWREKWGKKTKDRA